MPVCQHPEIDIKMAPRTRVELVAYPWTGECSTAELTEQNHVLYGVSCRDRTDASAFGELRSVH